MTRPTVDDIEAVYARHPLRGDTIVGRLRARRPTLRGLTELDLSRDAATEITDQNHVGGAASVRALAARAGITSRDAVLDLGCGLGGPARLLALLHGCRVTGVDISRQRVRDAKALTRLVGLEHLVQIERADMLRMRVPVARYDVLWGQGAWLHIADKQRLIHRWKPALRRGGRIAFEDAYLKRAPTGPAERRLVRLLEAGWLSSIVSRRAWVDMLTAEGFAIRSIEDRSASFRSYFDKLIRTSQGRRAAIPASEARAWQKAVAAHECGLIGYLRLVAALDR